MERRIALKAALYRADIDILSGHVPCGIPCAALRRIEAITIAIRSAQPGRKEA